MRHRVSYNISHVRSPIHTSDVHHASVLPKLINTLRQMLLTFPPPCLGHGCTRISEGMEVQKPHTYQATELRIFLLLADVECIRSTDASTHKPN